MADILDFELVTPLGIFEKKDVTEVVIPAESGEMGVMPGHDVMIVNLGIGALTIKTANSKEDFFVACGYIEIDKQVVRVIAEISESKSDIDVERATKAADRAKEWLEKKPDKVDCERAMSSLKRSTERLRISLGI